MCEPKSMSWRRRKDRPRSPIRSLSALFRPCSGQPRVTRNATRTTRGTWRQSNQVPGTASCVHTVALRASSDILDQALCKPPRFAGNASLSIRGVSRPGSGAQRYYSRRSKQPCRGWRLGPADYRPALVFAAGAPRKRTISVRSDRGSLGPLADIVIRLFLQMPT